MLLLYCLPTFISFTSLTLAIHAMSQATYDIIIAGGELLISSVPVAIALTSWCRRDSWLCPCWTSGRRRPCPYYPNHRIWPYNSRRPNACPTGAIHVSPTSGQQDDEVP